jgi:hypothetical protein
VYLELKRKSYKGIIDWKKKCFGNPQNYFDSFIQ